MGDQWRNYGNGYDPNRPPNQGQSGGYYNPNQMNPGAQQFNFNPNTNNFVPGGGYGMPPQGGYPPQGYPPQQYQQMPPQQYGGYQGRGGQQGYYQQGGQYQGQGYDQGGQYQGQGYDQGGYGNRGGRGGYQRGRGRQQYQQQYQQRDSVQDSYKQDQRSQAAQQPSRGGQAYVKKQEDKKPEIKSIDPKSIPGLSDNKEEKPKMQTIDPNSIPGFQNSDPAPKENSTPPAQQAATEIAQEIQEKAKITEPAPEPVEKPAAQPQPEPTPKPADVKPDPKPAPTPAPVSTPPPAPAAEAPVAVAAAAVSSEDSAAAIEEEEKREKARFKLLNESREKDDRDHLNVVFIGHVDAGKSTLGGQILYLTGMVDQRTIEKYEKEAKEKNRDSWYMAYIMDTDESERSKGKTVEVGRAVFTTEQRRYTVLDAPGHKNYVPNMIAGASLADIGVLVIAARKGEFETGFERGGQTREHAQLAKTLGVQKLVVAVNKMDDPSICKNSGVWDKGRYEEIQSGLQPFLKGCGYKPDDTIWLPISALNGGNVKDKVDSSMCPWYDGKSLFQVLDSIQTIPRDSKAPFRMPVVEKYKDMGAVVMGKSESGTIMKGDKCYLMPNKTPVSITNLFVDDDEVEVAGPGENLRMRLVGVEEEDVMAGFVLSSRVKTVPCVKKFECQLVIMELLEHKSIFSAGYRCMLHLHSLCEECEVHAILYKVEKKGVQKKVKFVNSNSIIVCRIAVDRQISCETFDTVPQLGRFTLRDEGRTIAMGKITKLPKEKSQA